MILITLNANDFLNNKSQFADKIFDPEETKAITLKDADTLIIIAHLEGQIQFLEENKKLFEYESYRNHKKMLEDEIRKIINGEIEVKRYEPKTK